MVIKSEKLALNIHKNPHLFGYLEKNFSDPFCNLFSLAISYMRFWKNQKHSRRKGDKEHSAKKILITPLLSGLHISSLKQDRKRWGKNYL